MKLSLIVLYVPEPTLDRAAAFYGAVFDAEPVAEKHGQGPDHFSVTGADGLVMELYPATSPPHTATRLEFRGPDMDDAVQRLMDRAYALPEDEGRQGLVGERPDRQHGDPVAGADAELRAATRAAHTILSAPPTWCPHERVEPDQARRRGRAPELLHEVRALLNEFQELDPSAAGYSEAVTALREARDAMAAAVTGCDPAYVAARREGAAA